VDPAVENQPIPGTGAGFGCLAEISTRAAPRVSRRQYARSALAPMSVIAAPLWSSTAM
jgi:hypothetical protein